MDIKRNIERHSSQKIFPYIIFFIRILVKVIIYPVGYLISKIFDYFGIWCISSVRYSIGDTVCLTAVIREIKKQYSDNKIIVISNRCELFINNKNVYRLINVNLKSISGKIIRELVLNLNFPRLVFFRIPGYPWGSLENIKKIDKQNPKHLVRIHSEHFRPKIQIKNINPEIYVTNDDAIRIPFNNNKKIVLVSACGKTDVTSNKNINLCHIQDVVDLLKNRSGVKVIQIGLSSDPLLGNVVDFRGKTTLRQLCWLFSKSDVIISSEGLFNHIAAAFSIPCIVLDSGFTSKEFYSYSSTFTVKRNTKIPCMPCWMKPDCPDRICVEHLSPHEINVLIDRFLT